MKIIKRLLIASAVIIGLLATLIVFCNWKIEADARDFISDDVNTLPKEKVALVLGTSKILQNGYQNAYFYHRIDAAEQLYKSGKASYIIVSGDNSVKGYNEPEDMKLELIARGIPEEKIYEDFAGFRTLDSIIRAKEIFGQEGFIIISQKFHNERAVFLARHYGINAYGYNATDVARYSGLKTQIRERFARVKVFIDLIFGVKPKFGGEKINIEQEIN